MAITDREWDDDRSDPDCEHKWHHLKGHWVKCRKCGMERYDEVLSGEAEAEAYEGWCKQRGIDP